jgi:hypothetical protein
MNMDEPPRPIDPAAPIDVGAVGRLLLRVEADNHRRGWDQPNAAYVLYDARGNDGATDRIYRQMLGASPRLRRASRVPPYVAQPFLDDHHWQQAGTPSYEQLRRFVLNLAYIDPDEAPPEAVEGAGRLLASLSLHGVLGFAMQIEAWGSTDLDHTTKAIHGGAHIAHAPDAVEVRVLYAVDLTNRVYIVRRERGGKPVLDDDAGTTRGDYTTSLRLLVAAVTGTLPPPEEFGLHFPALADLIKLPGDPLKEPPT